MNKKVYYDPNSVDTLKQEIVKYGNNLIQSFDKLINALDEMDEIYNSPSGGLYKEKFKEYLENRKSYIQENYLPFERVIDTIIKEYDDTDSYIKEMEGDK